MADKKISQLTAATTPLAGTEVLPIVQSGTTVQVSVANLTSGRAVATAGGSFTDNITQSTAAKGINFTANTAAAGMTSELFNWYEEGTWTASLSGTGTGPTTPITSTGKYTRMGRQVTVTFDLSGDTTGVTGVYVVTGLPFAIGAGSNYYAALVTTNLGAVPVAAYGAGGNTYFALVEQTTFNYVPLSAGAGRNISGTFTYFV
jgi:hypothetical protein